MNLDEKGLGTEEIDLSQDGFISFEELKEFLKQEAAAAGPIPQAPRAAPELPHEAPELAPLGGGSGHPCLAEVPGATLPGAVGAQRGAAARPHRGAGGAGKASFWAFWVGL